MKGTIPYNPIYWTNSYTTHQGPWTNSNGKKSNKQQRETERETTNQTILMQYALSPGPTFERTTSPRPQLPVYSSDRFFCDKVFYSAQYYLILLFEKNLCKKQLILKDPTVEINFIVPVF
jgi:hypothetical protein